MDEPEEKIDIGCVSLVKTEVSDDFEDFSGIRGEFVVESSSAEPIVENVLKVELPVTESNKIIEEIAQVNESQIDYDENGIEIRRKLRGRTLYGPGNKLINNGNKSSKKVHNPVSNTFSTAGSSTENNSNKKGAHELEIVGLEDEVVEIKQEVVQEYSDLLNYIGEAKDGDNTAENDTPPIKVQKLVPIDTMIQVINEVAIGQKEFTAESISIQMNEQQLNHERSPSEATNKTVASENLIHEISNATPIIISSTSLIETPAPTQLNFTELASSLGYDEEKAQRTGNTLLHMAALICDTKAVEGILYTGNINVNALNKAGNTPLHCLCSSRAVIPIFERIEKIEQIFQMLINVGAVTRIKNKHGLTPLHILFTTTKFTPYNFHLFAELLHEYNLLHALEIFEKEGITTPLFIVTRFAEIQDRTLELLFKTSNLNPNISNKFGQNLFHFAIWGKRTLRFFRRLLENGVTLNNSEMSSFDLFQFALEKHVSFTYLEFLLKNEQSLRKKRKFGQSVLDCAMEAKRSNSDITNLLGTIYFLKRKARGYSGRSSKSGLRIVMEQGRIKILKYLLENGLKVNEFDQNGWTPFNLAMRSRCKPLRKARLLLRFGANPLLRNRDGNTALHVAFKWGTPAAVKYCLQDVQLDPNCIDLESRTPLHLILHMEKFNKMEILKKVKFLVEYNADLFYIGKIRYPGFEEGVFIPVQKIYFLNEAIEMWDNEEDSQFLEQFINILTA